jgi:hypothetical protein
MVQNDAAVPAGVLARAQEEVARLFAIAGVGLVWVTDVPQNGARVRFVCLTTWEPSAKRIPETALGYTQAGVRSRGIRAYVFWHRVERASQEFTASLDRVLAIAIAHELGHMLLPSDAHANGGLMEARWNSEHFRSASAGLLHFSPESGVLIRRGLMQESAGTAALKR